MTAPAATPVVALQARAGADHGEDEEHGDQPHEQDEGEDHGHDIRRMAHPGTRETPVSNGR